MLRARDAVAAELQAHTPSLTLAAAWSEMMRQVVATAARLVAGDQHFGWTWFVSGSVARGEAIPGSDVETLIALDDGVDDAGKSEVLALAADVHAVLEGCGLRSDSNGVLASRARFCRRRSNWAGWIERWCAEPAEDRGVVMTGLLTDATGMRDRVNGDDELRALTVAAAQRHSAARRAMLQDATAVRTSIPSRLRVVATQDDRVDLKLAAVDPIVKIARWAALTAGSTALSTVERLDDAATANVLDGDDAAVLRDCHISLSRIRWRMRAGGWMKGEPVTDRVSLAALAPADRAALRTVAREVGGIRRKLAFLASTSSLP
ncbi:MAG TPA: putative nucleotidyltransferase substrate binding domain-containing protein [Mycobacterium sp.]|nr:putative nucleotidyltransferase substrate binding domain-containing protein [Mycobacterium sp.]